MDINIFHAVHDVEEKSDLLCTRPKGPWYAHFTKPNGSFYQIALKEKEVKTSYGSNRSCGVIQVNYFRADIDSESTTLMSKKVLEGEWWNSDEMRTLADYKKEDISIVSAKKDFRKRLVQRVGNGYFYQIMCIHDEMKGSVVDIIKSRFKRDISGDFDELN